MNKIPKKVTDVTGVKLTPGAPAVCLGNGEHGFECCCDECDYYCFTFRNLIHKNAMNNHAPIEQT